MTFFKTAVAGLAIVAGVAFSAPAEARRQFQPFTVVNNSGYTITQFYVKLDTQSWSKNWLRYQIRPGENKALTFGPGGKSCTGKVWIRTLQRAEFQVDADFCYEINIVLTNDGLNIEY